MSIEKEKYEDVGNGVINNISNEIIRRQKEYIEKTLTELITKYDFIVGSIDCQHKLMAILPEGGNIIYSPHIESPTIVYAIKKFDIGDLLKEPYEVKSDDTNLHIRQYLMSVDTSNKNCCANMYAEYKDPEKIIVNPDKFVPLKNMDVRRTEGE